MDGRLQISARRDEDLAPRDYCCGGAAGRLCQYSNMSHLLATVWPTSSDHRGLAEAVQGLMQTWAARIRLHHPRIPARMNSCPMGPWPMASDPCLMGVDPYRMGMDCFPRCSPLPWCWTVTWCVSEELWTRRTWDMQTAAGDQTVRFYGYLHRLQNLRALGDRTVVVGLMSGISNVRLVVACRQQQNCA